MNADQLNATTDLVRHGGRCFRLRDLMHYAEDEQREEIHGEPDTDTPQAFWDRFAGRFPESADHLTEITPRVRLDD